MSLTLKEFREITKDLPGETVVNTTVEFGNEWSIRGVVNCIHIAPTEHTYSKNGYVALTQCDSDSLVIRQLTGKNEWKKRKG